MPRRLGPGAEAGRPVARSVAVRVSELSDHGLPVATSARRAPAAGPSGWSAADGEGWP